MPSAPRVRLCQVEPPRGGWPVGRGCRTSPRRSSSCAAVTTGIPAASRVASPSRLGQADQLVRGRAGRAGRVDRVAEVHEQLAVLPRHDVRPDRRTRTPAVAQVGGHGLRDVVGPAGTRPRSSIPGTGWHFCTTTPGLEVRGRQHHQHAVGPGEPAQRLGLVGDAVLGGEHRGRTGRVPDQVGEDGAGVLRLHGDHDDGVVGPADRRPRCRWPVRPRRTSPRRCPASGRAPGSRRGASPRATSVTSWPVRCRCPAIDPADRADAVDDVAHGYSCVGRLPRTISQAVTAVPDQGQRHADDRQHRLVLVEADRDEHDPRTRSLAAAIMKTLFSCWAFGRAGEEP